MINDLKEMIKSETKPKKKIDESKLINKKMLDQLYKMGFSLDLCKKALIEVKSSSLDAALNILLTIKDDP